eukprot:g1169.t1
MFIQTEDTPNPNSKKFLPGRDVLPETYGSGVNFSSLKQANSRSELAGKIMRIEGITNCFFGPDFVTVTINDEVTEWMYAKVDVYEAIMDFYGTGNPVMKAENEEDAIESERHKDTEIQDGDSEVVMMIKELLETRIRPAVQDDGGDIFYVGFEEDTGIVKLALAGSCKGCPSSSVTLKSGVQNMLMHYIPEVSGVIEVDEEEMYED